MYSIRLLDICYETLIRDMRQLVYGMKQLMYGMRQLVYGIGNDWTVRVYESFII